MAPAETPAAFLRIAHRDLRAARAMADPSVFEEDSWGFSIQQASEKALKAWLLLLFPAQPPFTHNLRLLFQMLRDQGADIESTSNGLGVDAIDMASGDGCAGGGGKACFGVAGAAGAVVEQGPAGFNLGRDRREELFAPPAMDSRSCFFRALHCSKNASIRAHPHGQGLHDPAARLPFPVGNEPRKDNRREVGSAHQ